MERRDCFATAVSFCCTIRSRDTLSFSCTLILLTRVEEGAMVEVGREIFV
jgi:hypothetical protein